MRPFLKTPTSPSQSSVPALVCLCWFGVVCGLLTNTKKVIYGTDSLVVLLYALLLQVMSLKRQRREVVGTASDLVGDSTREYRDSPMAKYGETCCRRVNAERSIQPT